MIDPTLFAALMVATLLIAATPGPSVALASAQAVKFGPRAAAVTVAGDALGTVVHICIAVAGLKALMSVASQILPALQIAGGVYILWLAYQSLTRGVARRISVDKISGLGLLGVGLLLVYKGWRDLPRTA